MASALYLDHYLDSLENLPDELQRNMSLMLDLDSTAQEVMRDSDKLAHDFLSNVKGYSAEKKNESLTTIQRQFDRAKEYGDDKVQLAVQTYEMVDKHIRNLDADLLRFESEIQDKAINAVRIVEEGSQKRGRKKTKAKEIKKKSAVSEEESVAVVSKKKPLKKGGTKTTSAAPSKTSSVSVVTNPTKPTNSSASAAVETSSLTGGLVVAGVAHSAEVLDMPVDPNEPTYCLCNQVSYGEMIGCDNPDCTIEWFHFACVKLITKPKGKWFCPKCITDKKKK